MIFKTKLPAKNLSEGLFCEFSVQYTLINDVIDIITAVLDITTENDFTHRLAMPDTIKRKLATNYALTLKLASEEQIEAAKGEYPETNDTGLGI